MFINDLKNYYSKLEIKIIFPNPLNDIHKNTPIMSFNEERLNIVLSNPSHFNKKKKISVGIFFVNIDKLIIQFIWEGKIPSITKKKKWQKNTEKLHYPISGLPVKLIKIVQKWREDIHIDQLNGK